jgi:CRP/FNR family transcriptional regulator
MTDAQTFDLWLERFPKLKSLDADHLMLAKSVVQFPVLEPGDVAYREEWPCPNYVMCVDGRTRVFKLSDSARELLIYQVQSGGTCVLTTQCLLSGGNFPAESVAETRTMLAAIPKASFHSLMEQSAQFRDLVLTDYAKLLSQLVSLVDEVAFSTTSRRLARRLLADAGDQGQILKTHQQLAGDVGSVREVVSRTLSEWEQAGWIKTGRGEIIVADREALARVR